MQQHMKIARLMFLNISTDFKGQKENKMKKAMLVLAGLLLSTSVAFAHGGEDHQMDGMGHNPCSMQHMDDMKHNPCGMAAMKEGFFLKKTVIDGYDVSFHIIKAPEGMAKGGSHHVMVQVEQSNNVITLQAVNSKVTHPNGQAESKMMMKMGDWYMAAYDLGHAGEHKVTVLFKTTDGQKHFGGIAYPSK